MRFPLAMICNPSGPTKRPPFQYVADNDLNPDVFLYFTDMGGPTPETAPHYPVVWIDQNDSGEKFLDKYGLMPSFGRMIGIPD